MTAAYEAYTVTWKHPEGNTLKTDHNVREGSMPVYTGETPSKEAEGAYTYTFSGWSPKLQPVTADITYTAVFTKNATVDYIDENGETKAVTAAVLTGNQTVLDGGWYAVCENVTYTDRLSFNDTVNLILCDGATLSLNNTTGDPISLIAERLNIFAQENGTGTLAFTTTAEDDQRLIYTEDLTLYGGRIISNNKKDILLTYGALTVNGGSVSDAALMSFDTLTVNGGDVAVDTNADYAIGASGNIAVNGGTVSAKGKSAGVHSAGGKITLSWTDTADSIYANSYSGSVEMKKPFIDSADHRYEAGAIEDNTAINDKTLFATHEHAYGDPVWTWTDDHKGASARFTCSVCQHEETRTAAVRVTGIIRTVVLTGIFPPAHC